MTTYDLSDIQEALQAQTGALPYLGCYHGVLSEVWYFNHVLGPVQNLDFQAVDTTTTSTCPDTGIQYPERTTGSEM